ASEPRSTRPVNAARANARRPRATRRPAGMPLLLRAGGGGGARGVIGVVAVGSASNMPLASLARLSLAQEAAESGLGTSRPHAKPELAWLPAWYPPRPLRPRPPARR